MAMPRSYPGLKPYLNTMNIFIYIGTWTYVNTLPGTMKTPWDTEGGYGEMKGTSMAQQSNKK